MTDQELIEKVAVEVMRWWLDKDMMIWRNKDNDSTGFGNVYHFRVNDKFNPLTNMNHAFMVVEKMRELGYLYQIKDVGDNEVSFYKDTKGCSVADESIGHAICLAALEAMEKK